MPYLLPVDASTMNYGSVVFVFGLLVSLVWYFVWGRKNYSGPNVEHVTPELAANGSYH